MKTLGKKLGLTLRLGALATALLFGQQAMAEGTRVNTSIVNTASVDYVVGTVPQGTVTSDPATATFVVDRRVNYTLTLESTGDLVPVVPDGDDYFVDFRLTNLSNDDLDFTLAVAEVTPSDGSIDVDGQGGDTADMGTLDYTVGTIGSATPPATRGGTQYVDDLVADEFVIIRVWGDAAITLLNGQIAGAELTATAVDGAGDAGTPGSPFSYGDPNTAAGVETVDFNGNNGVEVAIDGFIVQTADISVAKSFTVIDDFLGGTLAIPGAEIEYTVTVSNAAGAQQATSVVISDTLVGELEFVVNSMTIDVNAGGATPCTDASDGDGCTRTGQDLSFDIATLNAGDTYVYTWRVTIADPATTP